MAAFDPLPDADRERLPDSSVRAIHVTKFVALATIIAAVFLISWLVAPGLGGEWISLGILPSLLANLAVIRWPAGSVPPSLLRFTIAVDLIGVTACIHLAGGAETVSGPAAYVVVMGLAGILISERAAYVAALSVPVCYGALVWAEYTGLLPHRVPYLRPAAFQVAAVMMVGVAAILAATIVAYALSQLRAFFRQAERERSAAVSHLSQVLKSPLAEICSEARLLAAGGVRGEHAAAARIRHFARQAVDLIYNVLDAAKIEQRAAAPEIETIDVAELIDGVCDLYVASAAVGGVALEIDVPVEMPVIRSDRHLLQRAISGLVANAIKFTPPNGRVRISANSSSDALSISVRDSGCGISVDAQARLFEKRGPSASETGTGLGLYLVGRAAQAHGGNVSVQSVPGEGSTFTLRVPWDAAAIAALPRTESALRRLPSANLRRIYITKCLGLLCLVGAGWVLKWFVVPDAPGVTGTIVILLVVLPSVAVAVWPGTVPVSIIALSLGADILGLSVAIHLGGGVEVVAGAMYYVLLIGLAGLVLSGRAAFLTAGASATSYVTLVSLEYFHFLPHRVEYQRPPNLQLTAVIFVTLALLLAAWVVSYAVRQMRMAYRRAEELRDEAVNALSHDLKNPLNIIEGYATMIEDVEPEERRECALRIEQAARHALSLVYNVLDAVAIEAGPLRLRRAPVPLNDLVASVLDLYELPADKKSLRIVRRLAPEMPSVEADAELLERAIGNLISNGIKYTDTGGTIEVTTAPCNGRVEVSVRDSGCGIPEAEQARLFDKFTRARSGRGIEGTGLGLYIVRCVAEAHGGAVRVASRPGEGSTFSLQLPAAEALPA